MASDKVMGKQKSCRYTDGVRGGKGNHMFGRSGVGPQEAGGTGATTRHGPSGSFLNSVKGGSGRMTGKKVTAVKPA